MCVTDLSTLYHMSEFECRILCICDQDNWISYYQGILPSEKARLGVYLRLLLQYIMYTLVYLYVLRF